MVMGVFGQASFGDSTDFPLELAEAHGAWIK